MRVAIAGLPGTGKTTAAKLVADHLGLPLVSAGGIFRAMAMERNLTVHDFSTAAEADPAIDRELDQRMAREAQAGPLVMEGRLTAWVCREFHIPALKVRLDASEAIRAERIALREGLAVAQALADNRRRESSERTRYLRYYGVDMADPNLYDMVVSTNDLPAREVARRISEEARKLGP